MALRDEVELDVAAALRDIDRLGAALTQQTQKFRRELASSLDNLRIGNVRTSGLDEAARKTRKVTEEQERLRKATEGTTAATGKYGRVLQGVAQIRVVQGLVAFFGGRALVQQINQTVQAASNLNEEVARSRQVFGSATGEIAAFGETATTSVALARGEALRASNDFGTMFVGAGIAQQEAARLSETFVRLGADIASFSNLTVDDALTKLRAGLAGEIEPLRRVGFGFNDLEVQAKAAQLGLRDANGELTESAKLQARIAVILEKTQLAQGDLARTSEGLANQQRFLKAEAGELREELGQQLTPVFLELVRTLRENVPVFGDLATNLIPLLVASLRAGVPVAEAFLNVLVALSPILIAVARVIESLPQPLLQAAVAFGLFGTGLGPLPNLLRQFANGFLNIASPSILGAVVNGFKAMNPYVLGLTVAVPVLTSIFGAHARRQAEVRRAVENTTQAFRDQATSITEDIQAQAQQRVANKNQQDDLRALGLSVREFAELATRGEAGVRDLLNRMLELGGENGLEIATHQFRNLAAILEHYGSVQAAVANGAISGNKGLIDSLVFLGNIYQKAAEDQINFLVNTEKITEAQARQAEDAATKNGVTNFVAALRELSPAAADALEGMLDFGQATDETESALADLDEALNTVRDSLDAAFGRFLDAEEATLRLEGAARDLAAALGEGRKEGESQVEFQNRLREAAIDVARAVEDRTLALARAGEIESTEAAIQAEMRRQLENLVAIFPELRTQLGGYIDLLEDTPRNVKTTVTLDIDQAMRNAETFDRALQRQVRTNMTRSGRDGGKGLADGVAEGFELNLDEVGEAGRAAGARAAEEAAKEAKTTLRRSARTGLDLGGFLVDGITLGARQAEIDLRNFFNRMTDGLQGVVDDAMRIDPGEASEILQAVERMDQATRDLAEARKELGADSIEAKLAEMELAEAQKAVNDAVADAIDSTEAYDKALERVNKSIDTMTGALSALRALRDAQKSAREATDEVAEQEARLALFDRLIAETTQRLASARAAREAEGLTAPSVEERRLEDAIRDLENRRGQQSEAVAEAIGEQQDAQLQLIDSTQRLVELGGQVGEAQAHFEGMFRSIATAAGLSADEVNRLVEQILNAANIAGQVRTGVLTGAPQAVNVPTIGAATIGTATFQAATQTVKNYEFNIYETTSARATAVETVDEIRAVELLG